MAHARKDTFAKTRSWARHLRPRGKRMQAKAERVAARKQIQAESSE
ncbi:MAG: hypothetical protein KF712_09595 [Akkermansiaceae bacterium]|nr:hypothetical protein [Akkermansiaceae bacterium]